MSRIGKMPIPLPPKVQVKIDGQTVTVKGPKGELTGSVHPEMAIKEEDGKLIVTRPSEDRRHRELHGLTRALVNNMVQGVSNGFQKTLIIEGVGYRAEAKDKGLLMYLGYSHPITIEPQQNITFAVGEKGQSLIINGIDKAQVGQLAADLRGLRPPEPYKGKGIRYSDETIRRKAGKAGKGK
ncbi:MAG: 50S ribosomal protein L6 [Aggregatilineales bacterium]